MNSRHEGQMPVESTKIITVHSIWTASMFHLQRLTSLFLGIWKAGENSGNPGATGLSGKEPGIFRYEHIFTEYGQVIDSKTVSLGREESFYSNLLSEGMR